MIIIKPKIRFFLESKMIIFASMSLERQSIRGEVTRVMFASKENDWHALVVRVGRKVNIKNGTLQNNEEEIKVTVTRRYIEEGDFYEFFGKWQDHPRHGKTFAADESFEVLPDSKEGIRSYLSSSRFPNIGRVKASRIVKHFGDETLSILENEIDRLVEVSGISERIKNIIAETWKGNREYNEVNIFLQTHNIKANLAGRIIDHYKEDCIKQIQDNPYDLARHIEGIGFKRADEIAMSLGFDPKSPLRCESAILYIISKAGVHGHCYLKFNQIRDGVHMLLGQDSDNQIETILNDLIDKGEIKLRELVGDDIRYYNVKTYFNERFVAWKLKELKKNTHNFFINEKDVDLSTLSDEQKAAVLNASQNGVSVITGGPGVGKTFCIKKLIEVLEFIGIDYCLAAPTGKAAKRMRQAIDRNAQTMHRTLEWDAINGGFLHNEDRPFQQKFFVLDETSMVDIHLASYFLRAIPSDAQIVFLGDVDQLPSVGEGNVFSDMINSGVIDVYRLTKIFRQGKESEIVKFAHQINRQEIPEIDSPLETKGLWESDVDCMFMESGIMAEGDDRKDFPTWNTLRYKDGDIKSVIKRLYKETIPKHHNNPEDIQVLIPMKKGGLGITEMNRYLQKELNPKRREEDEITMGDNIFRLGDKVIQTRNNYDLGVFNGDVGKIVHVSTEDPKNRSIKVNFDDEQVVDLTTKDMLDLELAYCLTIHKSQGSEYEYVILPIMMQYGRMLYKQLIYTALTRAKKRAIFVGQFKALETAINNSDMKLRQSTLDELLKMEDEEKVELDSELKGWGWDAE